MSENINFFICLVHPSMQMRFQTAALDYQVQYIQISSNQPISILVGVQSYSRPRRSRFTAIAVPLVLVLLILSLNRLSLHFIYTRRPCLLKMFKSLKLKIHKMTFRKNSPRRIKRKLTNAEFNDLKLNRFHTGAEPSWYCRPICNIRYCDVRMRCDSRRCYHCSIIWWIIITKAAEWQVYIYIYQQDNEAVREGVKGRERERERKSERLAWRSKDHGENERNAA